MALGLDGRAAFVTGASQGIGFAVAIELTHEDYSTMPVAQSQDRLGDTAASPSEDTAQLTTTHAPDPITGEEADRVVKGHLAIQSWLDIPVNYAGDAKASDFFEFSDWDRDVGYKLKSHGHYVCMRRIVFPSLDPSGEGMVINNSGAMVRQPKTGFTVGASINGSLNNFAKGFAGIGFQKGTRVVSMNSGPVYAVRNEPTKTCGRKRREHRNHRNSMCQGNLWHMALCQTREPWPTSGLSRLGLCPAHSWIRYFCGSRADQGNPTQNDRPENGGKTNNRGVSHDD